MLFQGRFVAQFEYSYDVSFWNLQEKVSQGVSQTGGFPICSGKIFIVSQTLLGTVLVGPLIGRLVVK